MKKVEDNMYVSVHYKGTLDTGEVFDSSEGRQPLEVKVGEGQLIKGFEDELMGMSLNEKKSFTLGAENAYGERDENLTYRFLKSDIPPETDVQVGQMVGLQAPDGRQVPAQVIQADDEKVIVDMNHPLAGESLTFDIEVVGISDAPTQPQEGCACGDASTESGCGEGCSC